MSTKRNGAHRVIIPSPFSQLLGPVPPSSESSETSGAPARIWRLDSSEVTVQEDEKLDHCLPYKRKRRMTMEEWEKEPGAEGKSDAKKRLKSGECTHANN